MRLSALLSVCEQLTPLDQAASWDNVGLITSAGDVEVDRVLVTHDLTLAVVEEARGLGAQCIVSYHPPMIRGVTKLRAHEPLWQLIHAGIALFCLHTAWDAVEGGVQDHLADAAGLLSPRESLDAGIGRIGNLKGPQTARALAARIKHHCRREFALWAAPAHDRPISRVAVAAGAGDALLEAALAAGAEMFVTGELRHHAILRCVGAGVGCLLLTHAGSERASMKAYMDLLGPALRDFGSDSPPQLVPSHADTELLALI